ncbi:hypothetical protein [Streptomyces zagrosensis]|uniref:Uncharacterized protein n=1 Tax=Streptomyces zagrosensis TaxID=1042984 RepID=A0A7W9UXG2_9ACTN|nr:hypothetical protein [Streptomyces zagrosensis]MBB5934592.1 hypothetical protein [Streptomyces zagrosensis]
MQDPRPKSPRIDLYVVVASTMDAAPIWISPRAIGLDIPDPATWTDAYTCAELRQAMLALGATFMRLTTPQEAPRFRVIARGPGDLVEHMYGMGCWQTKGSIWVSSGVPWTRCDRLREPRHICPNNVLPHVL